MTGAAVLESSVVVIKRLSSVDVLVMLTADADTLPVTSTPVDAVSNFLLLS